MNAFELWNVVNALGVLVIAAIVVGATIWVRRMLRIGRVRAAEATSDNDQTPDA